MKTSTEPEGYRTGRQRGLAALAAVAVPAAMLLGLLGLVGTASASTEVQKAAPISAQVIEIDAGFTPQQQQLARQLLKKSAPVDGEIGTMAQGGFDRDHWWVKISTAEIVSIGAGAACRLALPAGVGWFVCPPIAAAINQALAHLPWAGGFWAELYTDGRVRVGTW